MWGDNYQRYVVFAGESYYPGGGWDDFVGSFDTEAEAQLVAAEENDKGRWNQVVDLENVPEPVV